MPSISRPGWKRRADALDGALEPGQPFEGVVLALEWNQHGRRRHERVQGQQAQGRRTVDQDVVVKTQNGLDSLPKPGVALLGADQLDLRAGEVVPRGDHMEMRELRRLGGLERRAGAAEHVVDLERGPADPERARCVRLRVEVDQERRALGGGQRGGQVDRGRRLADAALLVDDRNTRPGFGPRLEPVDSRLSPQLIGAPRDPGTGNGRWIPRAGEGVHGCSTWNAPVRPGGSAAPGRGRGADRGGALQPAGSSPADGPSRPIHEPPAFTSGRPALEPVGDGPYGAGDGDVVRALPAGAEVLLEPFGARDDAPGEAQLPDRVGEERVLLPDRLEQHGPTRRAGAARSRAPAGRRRSPHR